MTSLDFANLSLWDLRFDEDGEGLTLDLSDTFSESKTFELRLGNIYAFLFFRGKQEDMPYMLAN